MSSKPDSASKGSKTEHKYTPQTEVHKLEKKLSAAERRGRILTDQPISGLTVQTTKSNGEDAVVIVVGQAGNTPSQLVIHRALGDIPKSQVSKWYMSSMATANALAKVSNPYTAKTQEAVAEIKVTAALAAGLLEKDPTGKITYPDGSIREKVLEECRRLAVIHKDCPGGKPLVPTFAYATPAHQAAEMAYLNFLAENEKVQNDIKKETNLYIAWEATDPNTGSKLPEMLWAEGIPAKYLQVVILDVLRTGAYDEERWDGLKEVAPKKESPFSLWGYTPGNYPAQPHQELIQALGKFAVARRDYNIFTNEGDDSKAGKAKKSELHDLYQKEVKSVKEAEKFEYEPHRPRTADAPKGAPLAKEEPAKATPKEKPNGKKAAPPIPPVKSIGEEACKHGEDPTFTFTEPV